MKSYLLLIPLLLLFLSCKSKKEESKDEPNVELRWVTEYKRKLCETCKGNGTYYDPYSQMTFPCFCDNGWIMVPEKVLYAVHICKNCDGTGLIYNPISQRTYICDFCKNGILKAERIDNPNNQISFTGGKMPCSICRTTYCPDYQGKREWGAKCTRSNCNHLYEQHVNR